MVGTGPVACRLHHPVLYLTLHPVGADATVDAMVAAVGAAAAVSMAVGTGAEFPWISSVTNCSSIVPSS